MGVHREALGLMALARAGGADFANVATIGRHRLSVPVDGVVQFLRQRHRDDIAARFAQAAGDGYCEGLLKSAFDADRVTSIDASAYENADLIHDMNTPMPASAGAYSIVMDFGTLEHVFNIPVAFDNVAKLAQRGGHILHMLPGNNFVGHGFYQFSPEFFFQVYAPERGFEGTRVFVVRGGAPDVWYEVRAPRELRRRVDITSREQLHILVLTRKVGEPLLLAEHPVQQSDYVDIWTNGQERKTKRPPYAWELAVKDALASIRQSRKIDRKLVTKSRQDLTRRNLRDLVPTF